jgi:membrane fusion protein, heavy metal efflux system
MRLAALVCLSTSIAVLTACNGTTQPKPTQEAIATRTDSGEIALPVSDETAGLIEVQTAAFTNQPEIIRAPGKITLADTASWRIGVLIGGRIEKVYVNLGDFVREGQLLAHMHSHEVHEVRAEYQTARSGLSRAQAAMALAQKDYERAQRLYALRAVSLGEVERSQQELVNAQAAVKDQQIDLEAARVHLEENLGVAVDPDPANHTDETDLVPIRAAGSGYIIAKNVTPGSSIDPSKDAFVIGDLKRLWMIASINEASVAKLRMGERATVTVNGFPTEHFKGNVINLGEEFDPVTRVMKVRIQLENSSVMLRPEMLATAEIEGAESKPVLSIPADAIQQVNEQDVVFVQNSADRFEVRPVRVGETLNGRVPILEGLRVGEAFAGRGSFVLKSILLKASLESE